MRIKIYLIVLMRIDTKKVSKGAYKMSVEINSELRNLAEKIIVFEVNAMMSQQKNDWVKKMLDKTCVDELTLAMSYFVERWLVCKEESLEK